jgi:hypothetical protein
VHLQRPRCGGHGPQHEVGVVEQNPQPISVDTDLFDVDNAVKLTRQRDQNVFLSTPHSLIHTSTADRGTSLRILLTGRQSDPMPAQAGMISGLPMAVGHVPLVLAGTRSRMADAGDCCGPRTKRPGRDPVAFPLAYVSVPATKVCR